MNDSVIYNELENSQDNAIDINNINVQSCSDDIENRFKYKLLGDEDLDIRKKSIKRGENIIIEFQLIINKVRPFLLFKLHKKKDILTFNKTITENGKIPLIDGAEYLGLHNYENKQYLFFSSTHKEHDVLNISARDKSYFLMVHDIINEKKYYQYKVDDNVTDFFIKNDKFIFLTNEDEELMETPLSFYKGDHYKKIALYAGLGMIRSGPYSSLGPYYYFNDFKTSLRNSCINVDNKPLKYMDENITIPNTPIFTKGGIVKFAVFTGNCKLNLNLSDDEEDDSYESKKLSKKSDLIKKTMKIRDTDGKWAKKYDSVIQPQLTIFDKDLNKYVTIETQCVVNQFDQHVAIDYANYKTDYLTKNEDGNYNIDEIQML
jgi:hypothetical protein